MSLTGPESVGEAAGKATYVVQCGDTANPVPILPAVPNTGPLTVTVSDGTPAPTATAGSDYGDHTQTLPHQCGPDAASTFTFEVPITNDTADEPDERFTVKVEGALVAEGPVSKTITTKITDDDPVASIAPLVRVLEGDSGTTPAEVTVTLSQPPVVPTTVAFATDSGSALAGADFTATSGTVVFQPGEQMKTISVPVVGDTAPEKVEAFYVNLVSTDNGLLNPTQKQAGIAVFDTDKPPLPAISLPKGITVKEGDGGTVNALFTVNLSSAATDRVQVAWKTADFTAGLADYARGSGTLVFEKGQTSKTISVNVKGDLRDEPNEAFVVVLEKPVGGTLGAAKSFGIVVDDDGPKMAIGRPKVVRKKALVLSLGCPATADLCKGRLTATAGKLKFGTVAFELVKGQTKTVKLKMSRKARAALRKRPRRVMFKAVTADRSGATRVTVRKLRLKRTR